MTTHMITCILTLGTEGSGQAWGFRDLGDCGRKEARGVGNGQLLQVQIPVTRV